MAYKYCTCCVPGCNRTRSDGVLHGFPKVDTDSDRFQTWLDAIGGEILTLDNDTIYKYRKVCGIHFELQFHTRSQRLSRNAVPTLNLPGRGNVEEQPPHMITNPECNERPPGEANLRKVGNPATSKQAHTTGPSCGLESIPHWTRPVGYCTRHAKAKIKRKKIIYKPYDVIQDESYAAVDVHFGVISPTSCISREASERIEEELEEAVRPREGKLTVIEKDDNQISPSPYFTGPLRVGSVGQAKSKVKSPAMSPHDDFKRVKSKASDVTQGKHQFGLPKHRDTDIQFGVTSPTSWYISRETAQRIEEELEDAILRVVMGANDSTEKTEPIAFCGEPTYKDGCLYLACINTATFEWATRVVKGLAIKNIAVLPTNEIPKRVTCGFVLPKRWGRGQSLIGKCLQLANPELRPKQWLLNGIHLEETTGSSFVVVSVPEDIVPAIVAKGGWLSFMTGSIYLWFRNAKGKFVQYPPSSIPSEPSGVDTKPTDTVWDTPHTDPLSSEDHSLEFSELGLEEVICHDGVPF